MLNCWSNGLLWYLIGCFFYKLCCEKTNKNNSLYHCMEWPCGMSEKFVRVGVCVRFFTFACTVSTTPKETIHNIFYISKVTLLIQIIYSRAKDMPHILRFSIFCLNLFGFTHFIDSVVPNADSSSWQQVNNIWYTSCMFFHAETNLFEASGKCWIVKMGMFEYLLKKDIKLKGFRSWIYKN